MNKTSEQFNRAIALCRQVFTDKMKDYGTAWRILRPPSITDQIYIKANRIRSIEEKQTMKVNEGILPEFIGIVNYSAMALIQLDAGSDFEVDMPPEKAVDLFDNAILSARVLMEDKNHDYDEAWRNMRISSLTDIILMKIRRIKQIEDRQGATFVSEGLDANYRDIINYALFALIKLEENQKNN